MRNALIVIFAVLAGIAGFYLGGLWQPANDDPQTGDKRELARVGDFRPAFSHGTTTGSIDNIDNYNGKVVLLNFWATWCEPCRVEMPMLQALQHEYGPRGFQVIGIAMDDVARVRDFVTEMDIQYPNLVGAGDVMMTGLSYGNSSGTLPYSVLIDRDGTIRWREHGEIKMETFSDRLEKIL